MGRKKCSDHNKQKRKSVRTTIEMKKKIINQFESGIRVFSLSKEFNMPRTTISSIIKIKDAIKSAEVAKGVTVLDSKRSPLLENVEKALLVWITEKQMAGDCVSGAMICEKAKQVYQDLQRDTTTNSANDCVDFKASNGWFRNFRKRTGIHSVVPHGEAAEAAKKFVIEFKNFVDTEEYVPQQVFKCDETGLFWKKMPRRTYITQEEKSLPGHKPMKDRLTLMLCGNATGVCKIKPLLIYNSENPSVFKKNNVIKSRLNVLWRSNRKACVTRQFFLEWIHEVFVPSVKAYLESAHLPVKVLLVLDNAHAHPPGLEDILVGDYNFIRIKYLPPNSTPLIQPMDQQVISNFKMLYTKFLFKSCFEVTSETELTLRDFWKNHFNILHCLRLIDKSWNKITIRTMNSTWKKLWPECVSDRHYEGFDGQPVVDEIVALGISMGLEINSNDVKELVEDHRTDLTVQELLELHKEQEAELVREISSNEEKDDGPVASAEIKEWLSTWSKMQCFIEKWHPNIALVNQQINSFDDDVFGHFRKILKSRKKQTALDKFFKKMSAGESSGNTCASSRHKSPEVTLPVIIEADSPSKQ